MNQPMVELKYLFQAGYGKDVYFEPFFPKYGQWKEVLGILAKEKDETGNLKNREDLDRIEQQIKKYREQLEDRFRRAEAEKGR